MINRRWKLRVIALAGVLALPGLSFCQDIFKRTATPYIQFGGPGQPTVPWGTGAGAFNNNFWFNVLQPEEGVCVWVTNNNPTSNHPFSLAVSSTANPAVPGFTGFTGQWVVTPDAASTTFPVTVNANTTKSFFFAARSATFINLGFSGSTSLAGSPDTATIEAVLTNAANCSAVVIGNTVIGPTQAGSAISAANNQPVVVGGKTFVPGTGENNNAKFADVDSLTNGWEVGTQSGIVGNAPNTLPTFESLSANNSSNITVVAVSRFDWANTPGATTIEPVPASLHYGQLTGNIFSGNSDIQVAASTSALLSYFAQTDIVNPAAAELVLAVNEPSASASGLKMYRAVIGCSAACDVTINRTTSAGTGCTAVTVNKAFDNTIGSASNLVGAKGACTTNPTIQATIHHLWIAAGSTVTIDLQGYYWTALVNDGFDIQQGAALTGTVSATLEVVQRGSN